MAVSSRQSPDETQRLVDNFLHPLYLCLIQAALMLLAGTIFLISDSASGAVHQYFYFLENYVPMLRRYAAVFFRTWPCW